MNKKKIALSLVVFLLLKNESFADEVDNELKGVALAARVMSANLRCSEFSFYADNESLSIDHFNKALRSGRDFFGLIKENSFEITKYDLWSAFGVTGNLILKGNVEYLMGRIFESIKIEIKKEIYKDLEIKKGVINSEDNSRKIAGKAGQMYEEENCIIFAYSD